MSLSISELKHLETLSCIQLTDTEQEKFINQLDGIITFLGQLKDIEVSDENNTIDIENTLRTHQ